MDNFRLITFLFSISTADRTADTDISKHAALFLSDSNMFNSRCSDAASCFAGVDLQKCWITLSGFSTLIKKKSLMSLLDHHPAWWSVMLSVLCTKLSLSLCWTLPFIQPKMQIVVASLENIFNHCRSSLQHDYWEAMSRF